MRHVNQRDAVVELYEGTVGRHADAAIKALNDAEFALDSYTRLIEEAHAAGVDFRAPSKLMDAAKGCTEQLQSFYFGGQS